MAIIRIWHQKQLLHLKVALLETPLVVWVPVWLMREAIFFWVFLIAVQTQQLTILQSMT